LKAKWFYGLPVLSAIIPLLALSSSAQAQNPFPGPPADWAGHPPIHIRRFATTSPTGYRPDQIRHAYGFDRLSSTSTGAGQTIAIVDAYDHPTIQNDLNTFSRQFGLPPASFQKVYAQNAKPRVDGGWALEIALDVEWAHAIAPGANILLVEAKSNRFSDLLGAVDVAVRMGAKQVSMSWGGSEFSGETSYDSYFNRSGVTFTASSGDDGAGVLWPAVSSYVTSVGGTSLYLDSSDNRMTETAWSGSGGGVSSYVNKPAYQNGWQSLGKRTVPDVSYNADPNTGFPVYSSVAYQGTSGWFQVGGTSAGAPQWAALVALANANRSSSLNTTLYSLGSQTNFPSSYFIDIMDGTNGGYSAIQGYDNVTGIGSPLAAQLVPALSGSVVLAP
jgi:subtilase family serine protease